MMTLNYNEKDYQKKLQKDIEMPEIVHEHINQAYRLIENNAVLQKKASKDPYHWMKSGGRIAGGMAAVLAAVLFFYRELFYIGFVENAARISGVSVRNINFIFTIIFIIYHED